MKICKTIRYYVVADGKKYTFGKATGDMLEARLILYRARNIYPAETWNIVALKAT